MAVFLIVGGAGYIGSHVVKALIGQGQAVVTLDDLSRGHRRAVVGGEFVHGDLGDRRLLDEVFTARSIDCVMHFAALSLVAESVAEPLAYYDHNVAKTGRLLRAMRDHGVKRFIFSSSAAVYGEPERWPISEADDTAPTNPYGRTKLIVEEMLRDCQAAHGLTYVSLRYFNAAGADKSGDIGEDHSPETHLIPLTLQVALGQRESIKIFGLDYDTPDGTCIRDYVHVSDLAAAHVLAAERMLAGGDSAVYNLGSQEGCSVKEIIRLAQKVTGRDITAEEAPRRPGDPARLVASSAKIKAELGWSPQFEVPEKMIATAWKWHRRHPQGYAD